MTVLIELGMSKIAICDAHVLKSISSDCCLDVNLWQQKTRMDGDLRK